MRPRIDHLDSSTMLSSVWNSAGFGAGAMIRTLSIDPDTGATTALIDLPKGFAVERVSCEAAQDWLLVEGEVREGDRVLRPGAYSYHPGKTAQPARSVTHRATVFAIYDATPVYTTSPDESANSAEVIEYADVWTIPWQDPLKVSEPSDKYNSGIFIKMLRVDKATGEQLYLAGLMAGWYMPGIEVHGFEENYTLSGDVHIGLVDGEPGCTMTPGSYMSRPPNIPHGPIVTKNGNVNLVHVLSKMVINYQVHPNAESMIRAHLQAYPWR